MEGATATIEPDPTDPLYVCKKFKRQYKRTHSAAIEREKSYHTRIYTLLQTLGPLLIRVPKRKEGEEYCMEKINISSPLWEEATWSTLSAGKQATIIEQLGTVRRALAEESIYLKDVEAYLQPDGTICLVDFGQVNETPTEVLPSASIVPPAILPTIRGGQRTYKTLRRGSKRGRTSFNKTLRRGSKRHRAPLG